MIDEFELTLHSSLTKEDWDKLTDVELENTMSITFQTPQGRQVKYIKSDVLDKIRAEIAELWKNEPCAIEHGCLNEILQIIDKYKELSEGSDPG